MEIIYQPIGIIHSPFEKLEGMPIQSGATKNITGEIEIYAEFGAALKDLDGFSHIYALYHFHQSSGWKPLVIPFLDQAARGLFSTRAPRRPNPIGLSVFQVLSINGNRIQVSGVDVLNGTPLLDIKPYVPQFEDVHDWRIGWLESKIGDLSRTHSDDRFKNRK